MVARHAIIAGSQGYRWVHRLGGAAVLEPIRTPFGLSATIRLALVGDLEVMVISRHGESGYEVSAPFVNYRANIWALKELGVERIVSWSGPGAIDPGLAIGEILVPVDIVDETRGRPSTFFEGRGIGFIRQNPVFCPDLAERLRRAIETRQGQCRTGDVYVCTQGPRLETAAEIRKFATFGATLVGMTLAPEAFLARELEICYCPICYVTNYAEGVVDRPYQSGELFEGMLTQEEKSKADAAIEILPEIILDALRTVPDQRTCPCARSMERYRRRGDIGDDWRSWISK